MRTSETHRKDGSIPIHREPKVASGPAIATREDLIRALHVAGALEHSLLCAYLFTGLSLRRSAADGLDVASAEKARSFAQTILMVARQEMEHFAMVNNLVTSIGGAPSFARPLFPVAAGAFPIRVPIDLLPFSAQAVQRFVCYERPDGVPVAGCSPVEPAIGTFATVESMYEAIDRAFDDLAASMGVDALFVGSPAKQVGNNEIQLNADSWYNTQIGKVLPADPLATAHAAIYQIIAEGEGAPHDRDGTHFARYSAMLAEVRATPDVAYGLPVVPNPATYARPGATLLTHPTSLLVARLFDHAYQTMLLVMSRMYAAEAENDAQATALAQLGFFPMMTMIIRPVSEVLVQLPAFDDGSPARAGPPFEISNTLSLPADRRAAIDELGQRLRMLVAMAKACQEAGAPRFDFIAPSIERMVENFHRAMGVSV